MYNGYSERERENPITIKSGNCRRKRYIMTRFGRRISGGGYIVTTTDDTVIMSSTLGYWKEYHICDMLSCGQRLTEERFKDIKEETRNGSTGTWWYDEDLELKKRA